MFDRSVFLPQRFRELERFPRRDGRAGVLATRRERPGGGRAAGRRGPGRVPRGVPVCQLVKGPRCGFVGRKKDPVSKTKKHQQERYTPLRKDSLCPQTSQGLIGLMGLMPHLAFFPVYFLGLAQARKGLLAQVE